MVVLVAVSVGALISSCRSRSRSRSCWRSSSSRTPRRFGPTRRVAAPTSWRRRTSARSRASSPVPRSSSDYVLTVAVSVTAGVLALTSAAPSLEPHKVGLSLAFVAAADDRQPSRCARVRRALRAPDVRLRRGHVRHDRDGRRPVRWTARARRRTFRTRSRPARRRRRARASCRRSPRVPPRSPVSRRSRTASAPSGARKGQERCADARRDGSDRHLPLPRRLVSRGVDERRAERECLGDLRDRTRRSSRPRPRCPSSTTSSRR